MHRGWLAFLISVALHAGVLAVFCRFPTSPCRSETGCFICASDEPSASNTLLEVVSTDEWGLSTSTLRLGQLFNPEPEVIGSSLIAAPTKPAAETHGDAPAGVLPPQAGRETGNGSKPGSHPAAPATFFRIPARGKKILYLIDGSMSMGQYGALEMACQELRRSVRSLSADARFQILVFNGMTRALVPSWPEWIVPTATTLNAIEQALGSLEAAGRTDQRQALKYGLAMQPDVLFLLTDAGDVGSGLAQEITRFNRGHAVIHVIEVAAGHVRTGDRPLENLARCNHGTFTNVVLQGNQ